MNVAIFISTIITIYDFDFMTVLLQCKISAFVSIHRGLPSTKSVPFNLRYSYVA